MAVNDLCHAIYLIHTWGAGVMKAAADPMQRATTTAEALTIFIYIFVWSGGEEVVADRLARLEIQESKRGMRGY